MKKFIPYCLLLLCIGCMQKTNPINSKDITTIHYNTMEISKKNYQQLIDIYNTIPFSTKKIKKNYQNTLSIHTKDQVYILSFSKNSCGKLEFDNKTYYSCHKSVENLQKELEKVTKKYTDTSFYEFKLVEKIDSSASSSNIIKLEESNQYLRLYFKESISNFKIHKTDFIDKNFTDIDLIYTKDKIPKGTVLYIQKRMNYDYIRISFDNKYSSNFSIIPMFDKEKNKLNLITKKNPL